MNFEGDIYVTPPSSPSPSSELSFATLLFGLSLRDNDENSLSKVDKTSNRQHLFSPATLGAPGAPKLVFCATSPALMASKSLNQQIKGLGGFDYNPELVEGGVESSKKAQRKLLRVKPSSYAAPPKLPDALSATKPFQFCDPFTINDSLKFDFGAFPSSLLESEPNSRPLAVTPSPPSAKSRTSATIATADSDFTKRVTTALALKSSGNSSASTFTFTPPVTPAAPDGSIFNGGSGSSPYKPSSKSITSIETFTKTIVAIAGQKEYEGKSFEELRFEDYERGNKSSTSFTSFQAAPGFQVFFKIDGISGKTFVLNDCYPWNTITTLKHKIYEKTKNYETPVYPEKMTCCSKFLQEERALSDYNIQRESTIYINRFSSTKKLPTWFSSSDNAAPASTISPVPSPTPAVPAPAPTPAPKGTTNTLNTMKRIKASHQKKPPATPTPMPKLKLKVTNLIALKDDPRGLEEKTEEMRNAAIKAIDDLIRTARLDSIALPKASLVTLANVPPPVLYEHFFPFLSYSDLVNLVKANKDLTKALEVPLDDLDFSRFGCRDHNCLTRGFTWNSKGCAKRSTKGLIEQELKTDLGSINCSSCWATICQVQPGQEDSKQVKFKVKKGSGVDTFKTFKHKCGGCSEYFCNECIKLNTHECELCPKHGFSTHFFCDTCEEDFCDVCEDSNVCSECHEVFCSDCEGVSCFECGKAECPNCELFLFCEECSTSCCPSCNEGEALMVFCEGCGEYHCVECSGGHGDGIGDSDGDY